MRNMKNKDGEEENMKVETGRADKGEGGGKNKMEEKEKVIRWKVDIDDLNVTRHLLYVDTILKCVY